ncbi:MAG: hypothetical protein ABJC09_07230 [Terriglobia bacterium]
MKALLLLALTGPLLAQQQAPFRLEPGEYRWIPVNVKQIPTEIDCRFQVVSGGPTAHMEIMRMRDFRLFIRNRQHGDVAVSPKSVSEDLRRFVDLRGQYAVVVVNEKGAPPVLVALEVSTNTTVVSHELGQARRLTVILISFGLFFVTVTWCGWKLLRAGRRQQAAVTMSPK